jgi:hypothetical protein
MRGRLGAYLLRYQLRDYMIIRASLPMLMVFFMGFMIVKNDGRGIDFASPRGVQFIGDVIRFVLGATFMSTIAFLGIARFISDDRANGYFRFYFSKPVSITGYYVQAWLLHGVATVGLTWVGALWVQSLMHPIPIGGIVFMSALLWVMVGGMGFFLSALTNLDTVILVVLMIMSKILHSVNEDAPDFLWGWVRAILPVLMPTDRIGHVMEHTIAGTAFATGDWLYPLAYGGFAFIAGVIILRRTSFAR